MKTIPLCVDCDVDVRVIKEYAYVVTTKVWLEAGFKKPFQSGDGMVCIGCLESRLGRRLCNADFKLTTPLNQAGPYVARLLCPFKQSDRIKDRLFSK